MDRIPPQNPPKSIPTSGSFRKPKCRESSRQLSSLCFSFFILRGIFVGPQRGTPKIGAPRSTGEIDHNAKPQTKKLASGIIGDIDYDTTPSTGEIDQKQKEKGAPRSTGDIDRDQKTHKNTQEGSTASEQTQQESTGEIDHNAKPQIKQLANKIIGEIDYDTKQAQERLTRNK